MFEFLKLWLRPEEFVTQVFCFVRNTKRCQQVEHLIDILVVKSLCTKKVYVL